MLFKNSVISRLYKSLIIILLLSGSVKITARDKSDTLVIKAKIPKELLFRLRYLDENWNVKVLEFRNRSNTDTLILKNVIVTKPTQFNYSVISGDEKVPLTYNHSIILGSGSKGIFELQDNSDLKISDNQFTESLFTLLNNKEEEEIEIRNLTKETLDQYYVKAKNIFNQNSEKLKELLTNRKAEKEQEAIYKDLILVDYMNRILAPASYYGLINETSKKQLTEILAEIKEKGPGFTEKIDSYELRALYINATRTILLLKNKNYRGFLEYIQELCITDLNPVKAAGLMYNKIEAEENRSTTEFATAFSLIKKFCEQNKVESFKQFSQLIFPSIENPDKIFAINTKGQRISFQQILKKDAGKLFIIDLWASWCVPCRTEMPVFIKYKEKLKDKKISFLSISLDADNKQNLWREALIKDKFIKQSNQYKLLDSKEAYLVRSLNISSIPRYVLLNDKGKVINSSFYKPSDADFEKELLKAIQKL